jgi:hypothetical protein
MISKGRAVSHQRGRGRRRRCQNRLAGQATSTIRRPDSPLASCRREGANLKKVTYEQTCLVHILTKAPHTSDPSKPCLRSTRADRASCLSCTNASWQCSRLGTHHRLLGILTIRKVRDILRQRSHPARALRHRRPGSRCPCAGTDRSTRQDGTLLGLRHMVRRRAYAG